jgi:hypothetical protein
MTYLTNLLDCPLHDLVIMLFLYLLALNHIMLDPAKCPISRKILSKS